jgi:putative serine protease PepD
MSTSAGLASAPVAVSAPTDFESLIARVVPTVVKIHESGSGERGTGSGVVIRSDGFILTNNHVVSGAADGGNLVVNFTDGRTLAADIVGRDPSSDLAVIRVRGATNLTAAVLGHSSALKVGQQVFAVGSPLGLQGTVTTGIVSALHRAVQTGDATANTTDAVIDAVQTDAAINPGNSGGPLFDTTGAVVGINSAIATVGGSGGGQSGNIGVGFAIPIDTAGNVADQIVRTGHSTHAQLGVDARTEPDPADTTGGGGDTTEFGSGARVGRLVDGSPAALAGLTTADVITAVEGRQVHSKEELVVSIREHQPGEKVKLTVRRGADVRTVEVTLQAAKQ